MGSAATSETDTPCEAEAGAAEVLAPLRRQIDSIDAEIVGLLAARFQVVRQVAALKAESGIAVRLPRRIDEVCARAAALGSEQGLDAAFLKRLYRQIIEESCSLEDHLIDGPGAPASGNER